jgi:hypothetical protein
MAGVAPDVLPELYEGHSRTGHASERPCDSRRHADAMKVTVLNCASYYGYRRSFLKSFGLGFSFMQSSYTQRHQILRLHITWWLVDFWVWEIR